MKRIFKYAAEKEEFQKLIGFKLQNIEDTENNDLIFTFKNDSGVMAQVLYDAEDMVLHITDVYAEVQDNKNTHKSIS